MFIYCCVTQLLSSSSNVSCNLSVHSASGTQPLLPDGASFHLISPSEPFVSVDTLGFYPCECDWHGLRVGWGSRTSSHRVYTSKVRMSYVALLANFLLNYSIFTHPHSDFQIRRLIWAIMINFAKDSLASKIALWVSVVILLLYRLLWHPRWSSVLGIVFEIQGCCLGFVLVNLVFRFHLFFRTFLFARFRSFILFT